MDINSSSDGEYIEPLVKDITTVRSQYQSSYFILGGDFNLPDIDWESSMVKGSIFEIIPYVVY
jgi:hypothetical protein